MDISQKYFRKYVQIDTGFTVQTYLCNMVVKIVRKKKGMKVKQEGHLYTCKKKKSEVDFMIITIVSIISVVSGTF